MLTCVNLCEKSEVQDKSIYFYCINRMACPRSGVWEGTRGGEAAVDRGFINENMLSLL